MQLSTCCSVRNLFRGYDLSLSQCQKTFCRSFFPIQNVHFRRRQTTNHFGHTSHTVVTRRRTASENQQESGQNINVSPLPTRSRLGQRNKERKVLPVRSHVRSTSRGVRSLVAQGPLHTSCAFELGTLLLLRLRYCEAALTRNFRDRLYVNSGGLTACSLQRGNEPRMTTVFHCAHDIGLPNASFVLDMSG